MKKQQIEKPFVFGTATSGEWFTDREDETKRLLGNFQNGVNTIILSPRRWGKTSLIQKVVQIINSENPNIKVVNIDTFLCRTENDFYKLFSTEVIKQTYTKWEEWADKAKRFLSRLSPRMSFGTDPLTDFSISLDLSSDLQSEQDILNLPQRIAEDKGVDIVVTIDEFQQVAEFTKPLDFQRKLRSQWQLQKNTTYCLYGSKMHLLQGLFSKQSMPFYKFGDVILLQKINTSIWIEFICSRFTKTMKNIPPEIARQICEVVDNHSSYVQQLAYIVWIKTSNKATWEIFHTSVKDLTDQNAILYYNITDGLTRYQLNFLKALLDGVKEKFTSSKVISKYDLGSSANVVRIKKSLEGKEIIDISAGKITISDPVFNIWLKIEMKHS